ncbi:MAG: helix-turn-helix transcriptional regulator [Planktotalea sp.]|uniref:helix-turn-helix domain-containing protein n=1 Tax=Planktotalea sp. TaxID=2029877 RepID=UPI003C71ADF2
MKQSPIPIRALFGRNLRILSDAYPSISEVCRQLDINRAQFNRYLNGESYPRPDMLARICAFFETDARILTQPLESINSVRPPLLTHPEIAEFTDIKNNVVSEDLLPSGFYRFSRQSFLYPEKFISGLIYVYRVDGWTFIKGFETRQSIAEQGLPQDPRTRQFKGYALQMEDGIGALISRRNAMTVTFNFLSPVASLNRNFWHGYAARTINEAMASARVVRMVYEFLGPSTGTILQTARTAGFCDINDLPAFHRRLLRIDEPFM